jgi:uracil-DNA glycosylase family 4
MPTVDQCGDKWCLYSDEGKTISEHDTKDEAIEAMREHVRRTAKEEETMSTTQGTTKAVDILFVSGSPSPLEHARETPMVGPVGATFRRLYLDPIGKRSHAVAFAVPDLLTRSDGKPRQPTPSEVEASQDHLSAVLKSHAPRVVVALGKAAAIALGDRAAVSMPHPGAVHKAGDRGEVARKAKQIRALLDAPRESLVEVLAKAPTGSYSVAGGMLRVQGISAPIQAPDGEGTYQAGVVHDGAAELGLAGTLTGRYLLTQGGMEGEWTAKASDHPPIAQSQDLPQFLAALRKQKARSCLWGLPGQTPRKIDVRTGLTQIESHRITKANAPEQVVAGVVLDPYSAAGGANVDSHADWVPPQEVRQALYRYMERSRKLKVTHADGADSNAYPVEAYIFPYPSLDDQEKAERGEPHRIFQKRYGDGEALAVHSGAWVMHSKVPNPAEWALIEAGMLNAYSIEGVGVRAEAIRAKMPKVEIVRI